MRKRTKLKDIADALGVSITTVSRALNNKIDINQQTKRKILELAADLDYRPNNLAISLRKNKVNNVVGVVIPEINHYFFATVLKGIMAKAHQNNYLVIVGESQHKNNKEKQVLEEFMEHGVNGILLAPCQGSNFEDNVLPLIHRRIPTVVMDRMYEDYKGNYVLSDDFHGAFIAVNHLIEMGYKRIAHIGSTDSRSVGTQRRRGYLASLKKAGIKEIQDLIELVDLTDTELGVKAGYLAAKKLLSRKNPPDAIFTVTDDVALGVYQYAKEFNISIPKDLGIVGFSNSMFSQHISPGLSTVEQNGVAMGALSFDFFFQALHSNGSVFQKVFESKLIIRESSGA